MLVLSSLLGLSAAAQTPDGTPSPATATVPLTCCEARTARTTLRQYLRVRQSLLEDGDGLWSGIIMAWAPTVRRPQGTLTAEQKAVYEDLYRQIWRLMATYDREAILAEFSAVGRKVAFVVLHDTGGGTATVGEARCGEQYWLQPVDEPLQPFLDTGCTPTWVVPSAVDGPVTPR